MLNDDIKYEITLKSVLNLKEIGTVLLRNCVPVQDLQKLMDEAEHGVIYFSMGSNAKSKDFPDAMKEDFLRVFGQVKQTVIWKFEEDLPNRPKNVHIVQWAPQQSILGKGLVQVGNVRGIRGK